MPSLTQPSSAVQIKVFGHVQGVFFRASTKQKADELGLSGWVRNCDNGSVEIHAEGSSEQLQALQQWCWQGPEMAQVESVEQAEVPVEGSEGFEIW